MAKLKQLGSKAPYVDSLDDLSDAEWDGRLISDYFLADAGAFVPASADEDYEFAHENPDAWKHVKLPKGIDKATALALLTGAVEVTQSRHLAGQHDQSSHGHRGGGASVSDALASDLHNRLKEPDGGFTVDPRTGKDVTKGYAVAAFPERSKEIPLDQIQPSDIQSYADNNADVLGKEGHMLGGWHDPATSNVWLDVSIVTSSKSKAIRIAQETNQIAIFDLQSFESINTGGTGH